MVIYAAMLVWLAGLLPLWLDEVLTIIGAVKPSLHELMTWVGYNPGSSPLAFLIERPLIEAMGLTRLAARLPSVLFSVLSAVALLALARELRLPARGLLLAVYLVLPIQLRYAVEARPYAMALCFSIAALWCLWRLMAEPRLSVAVAYAILVAAGLHAQPFAAFVQVGALAALAISSSRRSAIIAAAALAAGCLLFAPWYLHVREAWRAEIVGSGYAGALHLRDILVLIREIAGGGYWQSIPLIVAAALGWRELEPRVRRFLLGGMAAAVVGAMAADAVSGYFFATRHALFAIPGLVVLASAGFAPMRSGRVCLALVFFIASITKSWSYFHGSPDLQREDWPGAAQALLTETRSGACIIVPRPEPEDLYAVFQPELRGRFCTVESAPGPVVLPVTRYSIRARIEQTESALAARGYRAGAEIPAPGNVRLLRFER